MTKKEIVMIMGNKSEIQLDLIMKLHSGRRVTLVTYCVQ